MVVIIVVELRKDRDELIDKALAPSTRKTYSRMVINFKQFCKDIGSRFREGLKNDSVELWLTSLQRKGMAGGTIKSHLSAIRQYCMQNDIQARLHTPRISLILKGIQNSSNRPREIKNVVTLSHLKRLVKTSKVVLGSGFEQRQFAAMVTLAFYAFLRPSELCVTSSGHALSWRDVRFERRNHSLKIKFSTYKHSRGAVVVKVDAMGGQCCPVRCLRSYKRCCGVKNDKILFDIGLRTFKAHLNSILVAAGIKTRITPHCFRHGGATWASNDGWSDARIKAHGRWRSEAYKLYVRSF